MGTRPRIGTRVRCEFFVRTAFLHTGRVASSLKSMDSVVVVSSRTSTPGHCCCCPQQQRQQRGKIVGVGDDDDDVRGRRNSNSSNAIINTRAECHDESMASVSAAVAIEEGEGDTSNHFDYWRVLNSISSIMFDVHTNKMTSTSGRKQQRRGQPRRGDGSNNRRYYTLAEVRTHNTMESAWVLVGDTIYDVTSYVSDHPGGASSILNKSGGIVDCTTDFNFHSKRARKEWKRHKVGILL